MRTEKEMSFIRLGRDEDIDIHLTKDGSMKIERTTFNEESDDWESVETTADEVEKDLDGRLFCTITKNPLTFRQLRAAFTHTLKA